MTDPTERWEQQSAHDLLLYWLERQPDLAFVAECDKKVVGGFVVGVKPWWDGNHLVDGEIFVAPSFQRKSIGSQLLKHALLIAQEKYDVVEFETYTIRGRHPLNWYRKLGFQEIKEWTMIRAKVKSLLSKLTIEQNTI
jgi:GNAT superfamily N-acetyltransferase